ncbi:MAG: AraC family transcriptional regulator, partial [Duncaniella sp.]|nr:AraC family transcriptional regulator [Duncaniella sp.]
SIARCLIAALLYQVLNLVTRRLKDSPDEVRPSRSRRSTYVNEFMRLVHEHHVRERSVAFYAGKLFISPKYLSLIIKESTGRSATEVIDSYVILEAKNLLRFSGKNIQQVAYELNFPNQSSFGKYFKHLTGMSPSEYQRS